MDDVEERPYSAGQDTFQVSHGKFDPTRKGYNGLWLFLIIVSC